MASRSGRGDVVFVTFPFTDLWTAKLRPAIVPAVLQRGDLLICQVTSKDYADPNAVRIEADAFAQGGLPLISFAQAAKLFTGNATLVRRTVGTLKTDVTDAIRDRLIDVLQIAS
ncbi:MAG: type II toxin-antitoxin system PemK/MazF family toxin [Phycisphaerae bacterium]